MHATYADRDALAFSDLERALLVLSARHFEVWIPISIRICEGQGIRTPVETNSHALQRAGEHDLVHGSSGEIAGRERLARRRNFDFLRAHDGDYFVFAHTVRR